MSNRVSLSPPQTARRQSQPIFTPPKSPGRTRKACVCGWGDLCPDYKTYFKGKKDHPFSGKDILLEYSNTCHFQNLWRVLPTFIDMDSGKRKEIKDKYERYISSGKKTEVPQFKIARLHWPVEILTASTKSWLGPMTALQMDELGCYADRNPPPQQDTLLQYNATLGDGQTDNWLKNNKEKLYINAPCLSKESMKEIAVVLQYGASTSSIQAARDRALAEWDMKEAEIEATRTPEEWKSMLHDKDASMAVKDIAWVEKVSSLKRKIEELEGKLEASKKNALKHNKRTKRATPSLDDDEKKKHLTEGQKLMKDDMLKLLSTSGGLSRLTIFNDEWHAENQTAAKLLFGYHDWNETKIYVRDAYFPGICGDDPSKSIKVGKDGELKLPPVSPFEKCLLCRMYFHTFPNQQITGLIFDRHRTVIGDYVKEWAPKWANVGMDLSCLDITADYLHKEEPQLHKDVGGQRMVYVDGKDWWVMTKQNDNTLTKSTFSSKTEKDAARGLTFSTAAGVVFEATPMYSARVGEKSLQRMWGSLGPVNASVEEWEDVHKNDPAPADDTFWTAIDLFMSGKEFDELAKRLADDDRAMVELGGIDDGVLLTGRQTGLADLNLELGAGDSDDDDEKIDRNGFNYGISKSTEWFEKMIKQRAVEDHLKESGSSDKKKVPVLSPDVLQESNEKTLRNDPNISGKRKLMQLERHERLHRLYEAGNLRKCLLSYFLLCTANDRRALLSWMGSDMTKDIAKPSLDDLPKLPLRLAKIPEDVGVGADKGFDDTSGDFPNVNEVHTPVKVKNSKTERLSAGQIISEIPITTSRAGCETVFSRVQVEAFLKERIPYWLIRYLPHVHSLAHGEANLYQPLRTIGSNSIVSEDYWDNVKDYTRIQQPSIASRNVQSSSRRVCMRCNQPGELVLCTVCNKWYHDNEQCHNRNNCNPNNPYN